MKTAVTSYGNKITVNKKRVKISAVNVVATVIFAVYCLGIIVPLLYGFSISLQTRAEYINFAYFPSVPQFKNYITAWRDLDSMGNSVPVMFLNSLWFSFGTVIVNVLCSAFTGYIVAKYKFPGRNFIYYFTIITMMIPIIGALPSQIKYVAALGGYNSPLYVLVMTLGVGGSFIIFYSTFKGVDWGYAEAAFIDGAGHFTIFFRIMLPQVVAPMSALALTDFISAWANVETPIIFFPDLPTLASGLFNYETIVIKQDIFPTYYAGLFTCMLPTVLLFVIFQKNLMDIQIGGGLKG